MSLTVDGYADPKCMSKASSISLMDLHPSSGLIQAHPLVTPASMDFYIESSAR